MTALERQIRSARHRLWLNRWLNHLAVCLAIALAAFAVIVLTQRLFDLAWPLGRLALVIVGSAVFASVVMTWLRRESVEVAAAMLDQAAGLRERLSSGFHCRTLDDPFARAVVVDAERVSSSLSARQHLRLTAPTRWPWTLGSTVLAGMMFLVSPGLLKRDAQTQAEAVRVEEARDQVRRNIDDIRRLAEVNPVLQDVEDQLGELDKHAGAALQRPDQIRHEAVKRLDNLADAMKQRRENPKYESLEEMKRMLRAVRSLEPSETPTKKLADSLAKGDFKAAREEIEEIKEQLATLKSEDDKELVEQLSKQLEQLAKRIEESSKEDALKEELEKAGFDKEQAERILESLAKKDLDQIKKELAEKGMDAEQVEQMAKQLAQKQQGGEMAKQLAQKMAQAAASAQGGMLSDAAAGLSQVGEQLSALEQLELEMAQLEAAMAALDNAMQGMGEGGQCSGDQPGSGGGMGDMGRGRGGLARDEPTDVDFKTERQRIHAGKGAIIGQFLVDGEQVDGEVTTSVSDIVTAAEREASDRISRDRIPRHYQSAVKSYFTNMQRSIRELQPDEAKSAPTPNQAPPEGDE